MPKPIVDLVASAQEAHRSQKQYITSDKIMQEIISEISDTFVDLEIVYNGELCNGYTSINLRPDLYDSGQDTLIGYTAREIRDDTYKQYKGIEREYPGIGRYHENEIPLIRDLLADGIFLAETLDDSSVGYSIRYRVTSFFSDIFNQRVDIGWLYNLHEKKEKQSEQLLTGPLPETSFVRRPHI